MRRGLAQTASDIRVEHVKGGGSPFSGFARAYSVMYE